MFTVMFNEKSGTVRTEGVMEDRDAMLLVSCLCRYLGDAKKGPLDEDDAEVFRGFVCEKLGTLAFASLEELDEEAARERKRIIEVCMKALFGIDVGDDE